MPWRIWVLKEPSLQLGPSQKVHLPPPHFFFKNWGIPCVHMWGKCALCGCPLAYGCPYRRHFPGAWTPSASLPCLSCFFFSFKKNLCMGWGGITAPKKHSCPGKIAKETCGCLLIMWKIQLPVRLTLTETKEKRVRKFQIQLSNHSTWWPYYTTLFLW